MRGRQTSSACSYFSYKNDEHATSKSIQCTISRKKVSASSKSGKKITILITTVTISGDVFV